MMAPRRWSRLVGPGHARDAKTRPPPSMAANVAPEGCPAVATTVSAVHTATSPTPTKNTAKARVPSPSRSFTDDRNPKRTESDPSANTETGRTHAIGRGSLPLPGVSRDPGSEATRNSATPSQSIDPQKRTPARVIAISSSQEILRLATEPIYLNGFTRSGTEGERKPSLPPTRPGPGSYGQSARPRHRASHRPSRRPSPAGCGTRPIRRRDAT